MHPDLKEGAKFPDFELPDQDGHILPLSQRMQEAITVLIFSRGYY